MIIGKDAAFTYVHCITTGGLFASVTFRKSPEKGIGKCIFTEVSKDLIVDFEGRKVGLTQLA